VTQSVVVTFDGAVLRPETPLDLEEDQRYLVTLTPLSEVNTAEVAWDILDELAGTVDAPSDWSAEHNHYLYGSPKLASESGE
jgi:hypothetical protein